MKKIQLSLLLLLTTSALFSQSSTFGVKAGVNYATIGGDASGIKSKISMHAGFFGVVMAAEQFGIQPELMFSRQGAKAASNTEVRLNYDYLNIPLMFNYYPSENFFVQAGPQLGVLLGAKVTDGTDSEDVSDQLKSTDASLGIGFGFNFSGTTLGLRYNAGLTNTTDTSEARFPNQVLQLSLGIKFFQE